MARLCPESWLKTYLEFCAPTEAPFSFHYWVGISTIASVLRRRVWIDQGNFQWVPNFYIILVAPPGIISKTTTIGIPQQFFHRLRDDGYAGLHSLPESSSWQKMIQDLAAARDVFEHNGMPMESCAATLKIGELGTFINGQDTALINHLVSLWDGQAGEFVKTTKNSGTDVLKNPWLNMLAATTPQWLTENLTQYALGGGLLSRCIFLFADKKRRYVAYPAKLMAELKTSDFIRPLTEDLKRISEMCGPMVLAPDAEKWGEQWYEDLYEKTPLHLREEGMGGYLARKQTHVHKIAMVLSAAQSDSMTIELDTLKKAVAFMDVMEAQLPHVYNAVGGRTQEAEVAAFVKKFVLDMPSVPLSEVYAALGQRYKKAQIEDGIEALKRGNLITINTIAGKIILAATQTLKTRAAQKDDKK